jgi:hypothetical protein
MLGERGLDLRSSEVGSVRNALAGQGCLSIEDGQLDEQHRDASPYSLSIVVKLDDYVPSWLSLLRGESFRRFPSYSCSPWQRSRAVFVYPSRVHLEPLRTRPPLPIQPIAHH